MARIRNPQRIDYVFVRNGKTVGLEPTFAEVTMKHLDAAAGSPARIAYSDHFGVLVELTASESVPPLTPSSAEANRVRDALQDLAKILEEGLAETNDRQMGTRVRTAAALAALPLVIIVGGKVESRRRFLGGVLKYTGLLLAGAFAAFEAGVSLYQMPDDIHAREAMLSEVQLQLDARRAFNGISW